jgi:transposase-like protein
MRRKFSKAFKKAAVRQLQSGRSVAEIARFCQVRPQILRRWREELDKYGPNAFTGYGRQRSPTHPKTEPVIFRVTQEEYERLQACYSASNCRSLSEFARDQLFQASAEPSFPQIEKKIEELVSRLAQILTNP